GIVDSLPCSDVYNQLEATLIPVSNELIHHDQIIEYVPVSFVGCENVFSFELTVNYDSRYIVYNDVVLENLPDSWQFSKAERHGQISIAAAGSEQLPGDITLGDILFNTVENSLLDSTFVNIVNLKVNEQELSFYEPLCSIYSSTANNENIEEVPMIFTHYPNPFSVTRDKKLTFVISSKDVELNPCLKIFNIKGQLIKKIDCDVLNPGINSIMWDGMTESGSKASSGIYFYKYSAETRSRIGKLLIVK
ncbi:MAG: T9SS type A sorting domain-containing protein, partial [Candidatus Cloacimonetes bacterium]|nr:T9SS type A sorting domain-containing protein [Candidatus Cloacimonadota bacterium]